MRQCLSEIARSLTQFVEQPRILDGDDSLGSEGLKQRNLLVRKRLRFDPTEVNCAERDAFAQEWTLNVVLKPIFCAPLLPSGNSSVSTCKSAT